MEQAEFDKFADEYRSLHAKNVAITGEDPEFFAAYKVADVASIAAERGLTVRRILDFGAGIGGSTAHFRRHFPHSMLASVDVSEKSLAVGAARFPGAALPVRFDGQTLPFADDSFDVAFAACVFHHIDHDHHPRLLSELTRVTRPGGIVVVFEHNPLNPLTVRAVRTCPFDENARLLRAGQLMRTFRRCGLSQPTVRYRLFFPSLLRALRPIESRLTACPLGAQYSVCGVVPDAHAC